jgi:hypothetical protein
MDSADTPDIKGRRASLKTIRSTDNLKRKRKKSLIIQYKLQEKGQNLKKNNYSLIFFQLLALLD